MRYDKIIKESVLILGCSLVFLGILINPYLLTKLFSPDGILEKITIIRIISFEVFLILLGTFLVYLSISKKIFLLVEYCRKNKRIMSFLNFLPNILLLFISIGLVLLLFEIGLRVFGPPITTTDYALHPVLGSTLAPNQTTRWVGPMWKGSPEFDSEIKTNSLGFRDEEHSLEKPPNTYRIAVLGDSYVEALQVEYNDTFHQILEKKLNQNSKNISYEVLVFGVSGYGTANEYLALKEYALNFSPDLVILAFLTGNDLRNNNPDIEYDNYYRPFFVLNGSSLQLTYYTPPSVVNKNFLKRICWKFNLRICDFYKKRIRITAVKIDKYRYNLDNLIYAIPYPEEFEVSWNVTKILLLKSRDITEQHNADFLLMSMNNNIQLYPYDLYVLNSELGVNYDWDLERPEKELAAFSAENNITYLPLLYPMREFVNKTGKSPHFNTDGHWNENGHAVAAEFLYNYLISSGILPE